MSPLLSVPLPLPVTWELDGTVFNTVDSFGCEWVVDTEAGWSGAAPARTARTPKVNAHGSYSTPVFKDVRTVALTGYCAAPDPRTRRAAEHRLAALCSAPGHLYTLRCNEESGALTADVELDDEITITTRHPRWFQWSLQLAAPDPRKYSLDYRAMETGLARDSGDGLDFAKVITPEVTGGLFFGVGADDDGLLFGTSNASGFMTLANAGTAPTYPVYTLHGPLSSPTLTTDRGSLRYNDSLDTGEYVVIDPSVPSALLDGTSSQRHRLNPSTFTALEIPASTPDGAPGTLAIGLAHSGPSTATGYVQATYRPAYF